MRLSVTPLLTRRRQDVAGLVLLFVTAFLIRLLPVLRGGGLHYYGRYDDGVYYTAAEALSFGHLPYRDYVLLHPPAGVVALVPFALLGRIAADPAGLAAARIAVMALGALNAVLVALLAARWGRPQAMVAGLIYACSAAAAYSEQATFLEPLGGVLTLLALLALSRRPAEGSGRPWEVLAGLALGVACAVKIWYVAPLAAVVLVLALERAWRPVVRVLLAAAAAAALLLAPFFARAPQPMWTMVVTDQLGRRPSPLTLWERLRSIVGTKSLAHVHPTAADTLTVVVIVVALLAAALSWTDRRARPVVAVAVADAATLLASPSYFNHYATFLVGPLAVVGAVGLGKALGLLRHRRLQALLIGGVATLVLASGLAVAAKPTGARFPGARFAAAAPAGCISADDPAALIQMNRLTADFRQHCPVAVDVTGASYGSAVPRAHNSAFHRWLMRYLTSARAFVVLRPHRDAFSSAEKATIRQHPSIATAAGLHLRAGAEATAGVSAPGVASASPAGGVAP